MALSQFYVTLPSTSSAKFYPDNKLSDYTTRLHTPLRLTGEWEVSLVEINYPRSWFNISKETRKISWRGGTDHVLQTEILSPGYYERATDILTEIRKKIPEPFNDNITSYIKSLSRKCIVNCSKGTEVYLNQTLARILGFEDAILLQKNNVGTFPVDLHRGYYTLYVYSDIVTSQYVGDAHAPLLRTVDVDHTDVGGMVCRTYNTPHYIPVKMSDIDTINIVIRRDSGELMPFESGQVICKLHFRLKKSPYLF